MNVVVVTPPLVQLNAPYPSGAYLNSYFKMQKYDSHWYELSNELFYSIFSKAGVQRLFELSENNALKLAARYEKEGDENTAFNLRRYVSQKENWIQWIDIIVAILCGKAREQEHQFLYSPFAPRGSRMENFLANMDHDPTVDDVRFLCSYALADLADYITAVFDPEFSLIRYAEHLTVDERSFSQIEKKLDSPVMKHFYQPVLEKFFPSESVAPDLICISVPFAGTFLPALYTARYVKKLYGDKTFVALGGGFVNTELREANDLALAKYLDGLSFDRGYGSYKMLAEKGLKNKNSSIYKMRFFDSNKVVEPVWEDKELENYEAAVTAKVIPDYEDVDFSRYPRVCDDKNPMHRLWNDGAWMKVYLAHGCYWHKCAFCDTQLDYVCGYKPVEVESLYNGMLKNACAKGVYGLHFVDEALPPVALKNFCLLNARHGNPLYFWGNVRFEKAFTKDLAAFLSYCGFGGASAGLEVATGEGLKSINKGTDIESIVGACAAFKEAGILVHAYMIYGFWNDTPQSIINSMETLRQFFAAGLLDSSFWHKFMLTRNSQVYSEWEKGQHPELLPIEPKKNNNSIFADNNLHFKGENSYDKFGVPLENALASWMHGEKLEMKVNKWFDFQVPSPSIPKDFIEKLIEKYEQKSTGVSGKDIFWLGSLPVAMVPGQKQCAYTWIYLQEEFGQNLTDEIVDLLEKLSPKQSADVHESVMTKIKKSPELQKQLQRLHNKGIVYI